MLALVTEAFGGTGGIAQFNRDFLRALDSTGSMRRIDILPRLGAAPAPPAHASLRQGPPRFGRLGYTVRSGMLAALRRPGIILNGHLYHGPLALRLARLTGARLVSILHGTEIWTPAAARHLAPLRRSDLVICVSEDTKARYLVQAGQAPGRVEVLHNTFEDRFCPGDRRAARARFGLDGCPVVLTVGRLDTRGGYKGHDRILPVIARLKAEGRQVRYLIAGDGADRSRLEALVAEAGIGDLVRFLGHVPDAAMPDLYRAADVFALPSTGEGFGIVFIEAMACGTPAIGLDVGGATEALGQHGRAVPEAAFEAALIAALDSPRPAPEALSGRVRERFGTAAFQARVAGLMKHVESTR